ncbi:MAG TPA: hypothetical protein VHN77_08400 [Phycisphaerales bacterium]|nr:hypothetical protein [Phycisphaerales bacterium]
MRPHPRIRKTIKWGGLVAAVGAAALWWVSTYRNVTYYNPRGLWIDLVTGRVQMFYPQRTSPFKLPNGWSIRVKRTDTAWRPMAFSDRGVMCVYVPCWTLLLASFSASALAWRLDTLARRREKVNACKSCGYDRTGLAPSSPCPECGAAAPQA